MPPIDLRPVIVLALLAGIVVGACTCKVGELGCSYVGSHIRWEKR